MSFEQGCSSAISLLRRTRLPLPNTERGECAVLGGFLALQKLAVNGSIAGLPFVKRLRGEGMQSL
ncbi:MAG: hypothetical protein NT023_12950 [Armatimonadetes bacterium]|nr:hypothetical protein [Armatimonadota bacterium]